MPALTPQQKKYIRDVGPYRDDEEIAAKLGVSVNTIKKYRQQKKVRKDGSGQDLTEAEIKRLDLELVKKRYLDDFRNNKQYALLSESYTDEEIDFYFQEYFNYVAEIEQDGGVLTSHERRALDQLIQTQIAIQRFSAIYKDLQTSMKDIADPQIRNKVIEKMEYVSRELRGLRESFNSMQRSLDVTRERRNKQKSNQKINVLTIIKELQDEKIKRGIGYWAALSDKSMESVIKSWRNDSTLETS